MSRRGRTGAAAISLFSFQDIITSVTAIMILLVLILTLELVTRSQQQGVAAEDRRVAQQLREAVQVLEQRAEELRREAVSLKDSATRAAGFSAEETERRREKARAEATRAERENQALEPRVRTALSERRTAETTLVKSAAATGDVTPHRVAALEAAIAAMEEANRRERERQAAAGKRSSATPGSRMVYNPDPDNAKRPVLLDVSSDRLDALEGPGQPPRSLGPEPGGEFRRWLDGFAKDTRYVVVILRPSGVGRYDLIREAIVKRGIEVGLELVGEAMGVEIADPKEGG